MMEHTDDEPEVVASELRLDEGDHVGGEHHGACDEAAVMAGAPRVAEPTDDDSPVTSAAVNVVNDVDTEEDVVDHVDLLDLLLPDEVLAHCFSFLDGWQLGQCECVSSRWLALVRGTDFLWKRLWQRRWDTAWRWESAAALAKRPLAYDAVVGEDVVTGTALTWRDAFIARSAAEMAFAFLLEDYAPRLLAVRALPELVPFELTVPERGGPLALLDEDAWGVIGCGATARALLEGPFAEHVWTWYRVYLGQFVRGSGDVWQHRMESRDSLSRRSRRLTPGRAVEERPAVCTYQRLPSDSPSGAVDFDYSSFSLYPHSLPDARGLALRYYGNKVFWSLACRSVERAAPALLAAEQGAHEGDEQFDRMEHGEQRPWP